MCESVCVKRCAVNFDFTSGDSTCLSIIKKNMFVLVQDDKVSSAYHALCVVFVKFSCIFQLTFIYFIKFRLNEY